MKLFLECSMGASGDMLMAALYELLPDKAAFRKKMEHLALPGVTIEYIPSVKCGITGTHITIKVGGVEEESEDVHSHSHTHHTHTHGNSDHGHNHTHSHTHHRHGVRYGYEEILKLIRGLDLPKSVLEDALGVYRIIGEAEAAVHGLPITEVHLHEIGSLDAVCDVVGCSLLIDMLGVTEITASPVHVGSGSIWCEHGILPVPAPAAAEILKGIPIYGGRIKGELCTPTGAALLKRFVTRFGETPPMTITKIGYGMGTKDFEAANCLRAFLFEEAGSGAGSSDVVYEISCNLDDMTPEAIGAAFDLLLDSGALDVYTMPIMMKRNRPAIMLSCLCAENKRDKLAQLMLKHTTTLGVRISAHRRNILERAEEYVATEYGEIRVKYASGFGVEKLKPEYADVLTLAQKHGVPFSKVYEAAVKEASSNC